MRSEVLFVLARAGMTCLLLLIPAAALAQGGVPVRVAEEIFVDSEAERYLRLLQVQGSVPQHPWGLRGFSTRELRALLPSDSIHPWSGRLDYDPPSGRGPHFSAIRPDARFVYNTGFAYGSNDGAVWAGRGLTSALRVGAAARFGPLSVVVAPEMFWTENGDFDVDPNGMGGRLSFGDARFPANIDHPQRFGDGAYARLEPGQSTIRLDLPILTIGASTANQFWGPGDRLPLLLGANAAGFPHAFVGTSAPVNLWLGKVHGRLTWGQLEQSNYSAIVDEETRRLMAGLVLMFTPRGLDGLEVGVTRFYHLRWPDGGPGWAQLRRPLEPLLKTSLVYVDTLAENQLASVFARWVLPRAGVEVFGEYARDDHNWDLRDFLMQPDHSAGYMLGLRKAWDALDGSRIVAVRGEWANTRRSHLTQVRNQARLYIHSQVRQGHSQRGQLLGSEAAFNGSGGTAGLDLYDRAGRWTVEWSSFSPQETHPTAAVGIGRVPRSSHLLNAEALRFWRGLEVSAAVGGVFQLDPEGSDDRFNLRGSLGARASWPRDAR